MHSSHTKKIIIGFYNHSHIKLKQFVFCIISSVVSCDGSALHLRWPREGTHQNTHYAGPDHAVPTLFHIMPARELVVTIHPFTPSIKPSEKYCKGQTTPFHTSYCSDKYQATLITWWIKPKCPVFCFSLCRLDPQKTLKLVFGQSIVGNIHQWKLYFLS